MEYYSEWARKNGKISQSNHIFEEIGLAAKIFTR
jgi:hypothetical protein